MRILIHIQIVGRFTWCWEKESSIGDPFDPAALVGDHKLDSRHYMTIHLSYSNPSWYQYVITVYDYIIRYIAVLCIHTYAHISYIYRHTYTYICILYIYTHIYICIWFILDIIYIYTQIYTYLYVYIYITIHIYIDTQHQHAGTASSPWLLRRHQPGTRPSAWGFTILFHGISWLNNGEKMGYHQRLNHVGIQWDASGGLTVPWEWLIGMMINDD